jgi:hypothetical protein
MKKISIGFILLLVTFSVFALKDPETPVFSLNKSTSLNSDLLKDGKVYGSLEKLTDKEKAKKMRLIGQAQIVPLKGTLKGETKIVIGWIGVQKIDDLSKIVAFKEPIVSSFTVPTGTSIKGIPLPLAGETEYLDQAIRDLEDNKIDEEDLKRKRVVKVPRSQKRSVILQKSGTQKDKELKDDLKSISEQETDSLSPQSFGASGNPTTGDYAKHQGPISYKTAGAASSFDNGGTLGTNQPLAKQEKIGFGGDREKQAAKPSEAAKHHPEIRFETTEEGCQPRVDRVHERVTIQNRAKKFQDNAVVDEGECTDSNEFYDIKRDYLCEGCEDRVNVQQKVAHPRYQEYWINRDGEKNYLSSSLYVDESEPYPLFDEGKFCQPFIDLIGKEVYAQVQTGYLNKFNAFKVVEDCHPSGSAIPIIETTKNCGLIHDFPNKISYSQNRLIYTLNGIEYEARGCEPMETGFKHEFTETGCQRAIDWQQNRITPMFRRKIFISDAWKIITEDCEPGDNHPLASTREGCEGQYFHDFTAGRSYILKRYYYDNKGREYVSGCVRGNEFLPHQTEHLGEWMHDDAQRVSRPKLALYIDSLENGKIGLDGPKVRGDIQKFDYAFIRNEHRATKEQYFEGCFRRAKTQSFNLYTRGDKTVYELLMGAGDPIKSTVDECKRASERAYVGEGFRPNPTNCFWQGDYVKVFKQRNITTYPDGKIEYGQWYEVYEKTEPPRDNYVWNEPSSNPGRDR